MLGTTCPEGRQLGPNNGSCQQRCCALAIHNKYLWPSQQTPLPPFLPPLKASPSADLSILQPEPAHLTRSTTSLEYDGNDQVKEALFTTSGVATSPFQSVAPFDLVTKNFQQASFSQANSIFVQSQTDYMTSRSAISKKTETCIGRWQHTALEPLNIQVPPIQPVTSPLQNKNIKSENISCSSLQNTPYQIHRTSKSNNKRQNPTKMFNNNSNRDCCTPNGLITTMKCNSPSTNDVTNGCSRTLPITWSASSSSFTTTPSNLQPSSTTTYLELGGTPTSPYSTDYNNLTQNHGTSSTTSSNVTLLQIKREPCQVSEVTTSNYLSGHNHRSTRSINSGLTAVVKIESSTSPKIGAMDNSLTNSQNSAGSIPVGIAVARQRLQEHSTSISHYPPKDVNRFGIGFADIGGATSSLNQNMFFAGTNSTMVPLGSDALTMGVSNVQNALRTPPTLWQYSTPVPVESMLPMPIPPVGFQLVRDPNSGQFLFLPTAAAIEPFQQAVVWPTYPQATASIQPPHLLLPPIAQSLQPPPLASLQLLGSDYLTTASTTLHQHTQTHSTRFVELTSDSKRKTTSGPTPHAVIKIEDNNTHETTNCPDTNHLHHQKLNNSINTSSTSLSSSSASLIQTNDIGTNLSAQLYFHQPSNGLIQIAPHHIKQSTNAVPECCPTVNQSPTSFMAQSNGLKPSSSTLQETASCLQPITDPLSIESLEASTTTTCLPDVQDATIQTDTPIMSEDDNTMGSEECSFISNSDELRDISITTSSTSFHKGCHSISKNNARSNHNEIFEQNNISRNDSDFDSNAVTSTNSLEEQPSTTSNWESNINYNNNNNNNNNNIDNNFQDSETGSEELSQKEIEFKSISKDTSTPVDLSGLELLSNISIEAIQKKVTYIKQEPTEENKIYNANIICTKKELNNINIECKLNDENFQDTQEQLGGLNLLCALAEQRINEEVVNRKRSSSSSDSHSSKKKKHKHSNSKRLGKKARHDHSKKLKKRYHQIDPNTNNICVENNILNKKKGKNDEEHEKDNFSSDFTETFNRIKCRFHMKCTCKNNDKNLGCCSDNCNWPSTKDLMNAVEADMRLRLADITRQCQEKKRELEEIWPIIQRSKSQLFSDRESTPISSKSSTSISYNGDKIQKGNLNINKNKCKSSDLLSYEQSSSLVEIQGILSDTDSYKYDDIETSSTISSKRKKLQPRKNDDGNTETIVAKKPKKSLVGSILASKNRINDIQKTKEKNIFDSAGFLTDETSVYSESSCRLIPSIFKSDVKFKNELNNDNDSNIINKKDIVIDKFSLFSDSSNFILENKLHQKSSSKHHSKHKKSKNDKDKKYKSADIKNRKKLIDTMCILTFKHLEMDKVRVLTVMGGLFYAGYLKPVEAPDVYAVTLDGERGNKPHIMSREEVLRDTIVEVSPASAEEVLPGTRVCAFWSQQYRCLYPGTTARPGTPDVQNNKNYINVEFDDGDNGRILLEDIRFLLSDYPIVEYDPNPLLSLGKRKRRASSNTNSEISNQKIKQIATLSTNNMKITTALRNNNNNFVIATNNYKQRKRLKKLHREHFKQQINDEFDENPTERIHKHKHKCGDELCKHRKHKKKRKRKKHHYKDVEFSQKVQPEQQQQINNFTIEQDDSSSQIDGNIENDIIINKFNNHFDPSIKEDTMIEEEVASCVTESPGSIYEPTKKKERQNSAANHSKIAAFLPARQLWAWSGKSYRRPTGRGRNKKQFYRTIQRGKEIIKVGDSAVFLSTGRPDRPYIGRIESMWETTSSNKVVRVKWFYHPEETFGCPSLKFPGALFESQHEDENDVQTISHKCEVLSFINYTEKFGHDPNKYLSIYDNNDAYYLAGHYDPTMKILKMQPNIP